MIALLDLNNLVYRSFHALPDLRSPDGTPTGAVFGLAKTLAALKGRWRPKAIIAAADGGTGASVPTFRKAEYPEYKAGRDAPSPLLTCQWPFIRQMLAAYGIPTVHVPGFEADDAIATMAHVFTGRGAQVVVVSSDKDLLQLVTDDEAVRVLHPSSWNYFGPAEVVEKMGCPPNRIPDLLALMGDATDNIPGCKGVGKKGAADLVAAYPDIPSIIRAAKELVSAGGFPKPKKVPAWAKNVVASEAAIILSRRLTEVRRDVQIPADTAKPQPDDVALRALFDKLAIRDLAPPAWPV